MEQKAGKCRLNITKNKDSCTLGENGTIRRLESSYG